MIKRILLLLLSRGGLFLLLVALCVAAQEERTSGGSRTATSIRHDRHDDPRLLQQVPAPAPAPTFVATVPTGGDSAPSPPQNVNDYNNPFHIPPPPSESEQEQVPFTPEQIDGMVTWCGPGNDFICYHGAICINGAPNFDDHQLADGTVHAIHQVDAGIMTQHCQCSENWTGMQCDVPVAVCDAEGHYCYNGGTCIAGLEQVHDDDQLFCDCSRAFDKYLNHWVGKNCEQKVDTFCDETELNFCLNGGICNANYPWQGEPCKCVNGFQGAHCEYQSSQVPDCTLPCQNGACQLGVHPDAAMASKQQSPFKFCACADNWMGEYCNERAPVPCGSNGRTCYHGSVCVERVVDNVEVFHCDCRQTDNGITAFAGRFCEFEATSFCLKNNNGSGGSGADGGGGNLNGNLFCVNNGECRDDPYMGCSCSDQYSGFSCEFEVTGGSAPAPAPTPSVTTVATPTESATIPMTCDLDCGAFGVCRNGLKDISALGDAAHSASFNQTDDGFFQHCVCQDGYVGLTCNQVVQVCPDGQQKCLHGSKCYQQGQEYLCDCQDIVDTASGEAFSSTYAGDSCEHKATSTCLLNPQNEPAKPLSFCVNNGECLEKVGPDDAHKGCKCTPEWTGPHCEMRVQPQPAPQPTQSAPMPSPVSQFNPLPETIPASPVAEPDRDHGSFVPNRSGTTTAQSADVDSRGRVGLIVGISLSFVIFIATLIGFRARTTRRKFKNDEVGRAVEWSDNRYRDNPPEQVNLAPRRASVCIENDAQLPQQHHHSNTGQDDVYMASIASPSRDPMATLLAPSNPASEPNKQNESQGPQVYIGPPRDEDGHVLHSVEII